MGVILDLPCHSIILWFCDSVILWFCHSVTFQMKNFVSFLSNCEALKSETSYKRGKLADVSCIPESGCCFYSAIYFFIFLSLQFSNIIFFRHTFSGTVRPRRLKFGKHVDSGQIYRVYWNQAAAAYSSLYVFIFHSFQFSNIKMFRHTFLKNCEA